MMMMKGFRSSRRGVDLARLLIEWSKVGVRLGEDGKSDFSCGWRVGF